jgi:hypothetical protein
MLPIRGVYALEYVQTARNHSCVKYDIAAPRQWLAYTSDQIMNMILDRQALESIRQLRSRLRHLYFSLIESQNKSNSSFSPWRVVVAQLCFTKRHERYASVGYVATEFSTSSRAPFALERLQVTQRKRSVFG